MGYLVLTFDDAKKSVFNNCFPIMESFGMKGCIYVATDYVGKGFPSSPLPCMSVSEILILYGNYWEIGSHTKTHRNLIMLSKKQIEKELVGSINFLKNMGIKRVNSIAYPGGAISTKEVRITEKYFEIGRMTVPKPYVISDHLDLTIRANTIYGNEFDEKELKDYLSQLKASKGFGVFLFHDVVGVVRDVGNELTLDKFKKIIEMISKSDIPVKTFQELQKESYPFAKQKYDPKMLDTFASYGKKVYQSSIKGYLVYVIYQSEWIREKLTQWYYSSTFR